MPERKSGKRTTQRRPSSGAPAKRRSSNKERKQFERFLETARLHGVLSDAESLFDTILNKLLRPRRNPQRPSERLAISD